MRKVTAWLALLVFVAEPAHAGMRATYLLADQPDRPLLIEVADNGDARAGPMGGGNYVLLAGSETYVVQTQDGQPRVGRIADVAAAVEQVVPALVRSLFAAQASDRAATLTISKGGPRDIAGVAGTEYSVTGLDEGHPDRAQSFVISTDPKLAPVGRAYARFLESTLLLLSGLVGDGARKTITQLRQVAALGTPLRAGDHATLVTYEADVSVPQARMKLPAAPKSVDEIAESLRETALTR